MELKDLKVVSANVQVDNSNEVNGKYKISASFRTKDGAIKGIDSGMVISKESSEHDASFYKNIEFEDSLHITYMNEAANNVATQCEINQLINDFVVLAMAKAVEEAAE
jgi:hypothetical protein